MASFWLLLGPMNFSLPRNAYPQREEGPELKTKLDLQLSGTNWQLHLTIWLSLISEKISIFDDHHF